MEHAAVHYESVRHTVVLFGARTTTATVGDTCVRAGSSSTRVADLFPGARSGHAMAYDRTRQPTVPTQCLQPEEEEE